MLEMMKNVNSTDLQIRVATERDEIAYRELFLFFYTPLFQFANCIIKEPEAAEEIVSDVMMKVWEMGESLTEIRCLKVYLYKSVKNRALNYLSRNPRSKIISLDADDFAIDMKSGFLDPENSLLHKELQEGITAAIHSLPPRCQVVYKLIRVDGLCYREVANIMSISIKTVDRHLNNALHKLVFAMKVYAD
jgi:RNA polymerase sigma-70 factor (ECF subfamily)